MQHIGKNCSVGHKLRGFAVIDTPLIPSNTTR